MKTNPRYVVVQGAGDFPIDMLRYDKCWPYSASDAGSMVNSLNQERNAHKRAIMLEMVAFNYKWPSFTKDRWKSFGWEVLLETSDASIALTAIRQIEKRGYVPS